VIKAEVARIERQRNPGPHILRRGVPGFASAQPGLRLIALSFFAFLAGGAKAQDFYAGKTLTIIAGLPPGGGVDGEMRVLA
jgi:hypothetical protein